MSIGLQEADERSIDGNGPLDMVCHYCMQPATWRCSGAQSSHKATWQED
jgi:hypothetical protein